MQKDSNNDDISAKPPLPSSVAWDGNLKDVVFAVKHVNAHTVMNKWITIDESDAFSLLHKEKKATMTSQCRIVVRGSKHFPLQVSAGKTVEDLFPTWAFLRMIDDHFIPKASMRAKDDGPMDGTKLEKWVTDFISKLKTRMMTSRDPYHEFGCLDAAFHTCEGIAQETTAKQFPKSQPVRSPVSRDLATPPPPTSQPATPQAATANSPVNETPQEVAALPPVTQASGGDRTLPTAAPATKPRDQGQNSQAPSTHQGKAARLWSKIKSVHIVGNNSGPQQQQLPPADLHHDDDAESSDDEFDDDMEGVSARHSALLSEMNNAFATGFPGLRLWMKCHFTCPRPTTREEWEHRSERVELVRRNRTVAAMVTTASVVFLMRVVSFDLFLVLLLGLEMLVFYLCTNYRALMMHFAKKKARGRIDRVKDWFTFGVRKKKGDKKNSAEN